MKIQSQNCKEKYEGGGGGDGGGGDLVVEVVSPLSLDRLVSYCQPDAFWRGHLGRGYSFEGVIKTSGHYDFEGLHLGNMFSFRV